jgi:outer membrane protein assembly factor BamD
MRKPLAFALCILAWGCGRNTTPVTPPSAIYEPDRDLYERAMQSLDRSRYTESRLLLQTVISTYPDSEFLMQAYYGLAESFYREGTTAMLAQAEAQFKDYITFFPVTDLTDDAQLMVAMTHIEQLEKPDRDNTHAVLAELELQKMIADYPDSPLLDEAKQKLRDVQEVLAEGIYKVANHYYIRRGYAASTSRYKEILEKYPDFSQIDDTLFLLAESLRQMNNEGESGIYYTRLVTDHPLSERAEEAKERLAALSLPIPDANPVALARAQERVEEKGLFGKMFSMFSRRPGVSTETNAASVRDDSQPEPESGNGAFTIDPRVVPPNEQ